MAVVAIRGVEKSYGQKASRGWIDLLLQDGEFCVLAGPAGAGKTTLLRNIAGLESTDEGTIEIDGLVVNDWPPRDRNVAMVFQNDAVFPALSVYDNIAFGLRTRRTPKAEVDARVRRLTDSFGLTDVLGRSAGGLPAGTRRLVAIGRALVRDAAICLFDDPLAALDAPLREAMRGEIKRLHREFPTTKLFATRDPAEAMALGERVAVIRDGRIEQDGAPLDLFERPATRFVAGFFGSPPINFLPGTLGRTGAGDGVRLAGDGMVMPLPPNRLPKKAADGSAVVLGIRPEHMMRAVRVSPPDGAVRHDAEVEILQPAGPRLYATFKMGGVPIVAELQAHDVSRPGDHVPIDINLKRISIFDAATEEAL